MAKRSYSYRITVEPLSGPSPDTPLPQPLVFEATNHDDIVAIAERMRRNTGLSADDAASTAIGLKLLSEMVLKEKSNPLFDPLRGAFGPFIAKLKAVGQTPSEQR